MLACVNAFGQSYQKSFSGRTPKWLGPRQPRGRTPRTTSLVDGSTALRCSTIARILGASQSGGQDQSNEADMVAFQKG